MPIYEYRCRSCGKKASFLVRSFSQPFAPSCPSCNSSDLSRLVGSVAYHKSTQTVHEESGEPSMHNSPDYYKDPRNIGRWAEKRFSEMGMDMPDSLKEKIQAAREGELPDSLNDLKSASPDATFS
ncbi:MAG: zinc ribbon domain-containing protein [Chloroflexi bacterium]|nr:zinc ribbon domain-containing protein [Chloroflexota bacterium]